MIMSVGNLQTSAHTKMYNTSDDRRTKWVKGVKAAERLNPDALTSSPPHPHTVGFGTTVLQQLDQVVFVVVELEVRLKKADRRKIKIISNYEPSREIKINQSH